jgi:hypothetical protein
MAQDPEARAQLARLLRDVGLRLASPDDIQAAVDHGFDTLVEGIVAEAAASDDVTDRESAIAFVRLRLESLEGMLTVEQSSRLLESLQEKIEAL